LPDKHADTSGSLYPLTLEQVITGLRSRVRILRLRSLAVSGQTLPGNRPEGISKRPSSEIFATDANNGASDENGRAIRPAVSLLGDLT